MAHTWNEERARKRINTRMEEVEEVDIKDYVRDTDLGNLPRSTAYRVEGTHVYVDILNLEEILGTTTDEGVTCHRRTLRFLNLHYRAVRRILQATDVIEVDFHNQRLHAVVAKPYGDEETRVHRGVAVAQLIMDVLQRTGEDADDIPSAAVRVGIDTGTALAVNNGRRGHREALFLGPPANHAAKRAGGGNEPGIFLTNAARGVIGLDPVDDEDDAALTEEEVLASEGHANLDVDADEIVDKWEGDLETNPIGRFEFSGHTPPFSSLDLESLSPANSKRQDAVSVYADIDGFTAYVGERVDDEEQAKDVVRTLHVLRGELDAVLDADFGGTKVRFIGDCVHGVLAEGTAQTTDDEETISTVTLCAGGMRSSFELALALLAQEGIDTGELGLAIGFEFGPIALTRLGMKGAMVRCGVGRSVLESEEEQLRCVGTETAMGPVAYDEASAPVRELFGPSRVRSGLDYPTVVEALADSGDKTAKASRALARAAASGGLLENATTAPTAFAFPPRNVAPTRPAGFA
jgi:class 3 adenylate cyclase